MGQKKIAVTGAEIDQERDHARATVLEIEVEDRTGINQLGPVTDQLVNHQREKHEHLDVVHHHHLIVLGHLARPFDRVNMTPTNRSKGAEEDGTNGR